MSQFSKVEVTPPQADEVKWVPCAKCNQLTCHGVLAHVTWRYDEQDGFWEAKDYLTLICRGCRAVSFCLESTDVTAVDLDEDGNPFQALTSRCYPGRRAGGRQLDRHYLLPHTVKTIYEETHAALCNEQPILAGIGIRAISEAVCAVKVATGKVLKEQITSLGSMGHITRAEVSILQSLRFMGNKKRPTRSKLTRRLNWQRPSL